MDASATTQDVTPRTGEAATDAANRPIKVFRMDDVSASIAALAVGAATAGAC